MKNLTLIIAISLLVFCTTKQTTSAQSINYDSLRVALEEMYAEDQEIRRILVDSIGFDSPNAGPFIKRMKDIDSANRSKIQVVLDNYGWMEKSKVGEKASEALFLIVQHANVELMDKWYPEFKRLADMGEANPRQCAMMGDRLLMWKGKRQIYGTQASAGFRADRKMAIWPIEDPENVNERRAKLGFTTTVEEYAADLGAVFDINDQLPGEQN